MKKTIIKVIIIMVILWLFGKTKPFLASSNTKVNLIFDKTSYSPGETIHLAINLENFTNLSETRILIKINETKLTPIKVNNQYGQLTQCSIYDEALLNEYVQGDYLRLHLVKKSLISGYYSGYKNNIGEFYFEANVYINNIYDLFKDGSFENMTSGINITLYDIYNQNISYTMQYSEKIKISWEQEKYVMEVNSEVPSYFNDLKVLNRSSDQYEVIYQSTIDNQKLGTSVINIVVYDKTNGDYVLLSKAIEIIDSLAPVITGHSEINLNSSNLTVFDVNEYFEAKDNFDQNLIIDINYYNDEEIMLDDFSAFFLYLKHHYHGTIQIKARDASSNTSEPFIIQVNIKDDVAPKVTEITEYVVMDYELDSFQFESLITVEDDYDLNPKLYFSCYVNDQIVDYLEMLQKGSSVQVKYYALDENQNHSIELSCILKVVDTTCPIVNEINDLEIIDTEFVNYPFFQDIIYSDNIDSSPLLVITYYLDDTIAKYNDWLKGVATKGYGSFSYYVVDYSQNSSEKYYVQIKIIDTTAPIIKVQNVKDNMKYTKLNKIEYEIIDNINTPLDVQLSLNDIEYKDTAITEPGEYELKIIATDKAGNTSELKIHFTIIKDNFIGCGNDITCYTTNYLDVVIIAGILMLVILTIIIVKICLACRKKKLR